MTNQHELNVEYLTAKGWRQLDDGQWIPKELYIDGAVDPCSFEMAMNLQCELDGEPIDISCLAGAIE